LLPRSFFLFIVLKQGVNDEYEHGHLFLGQTWLGIHKEFIQKRGTHFIILKSFAPVIV
jgi:hypothetical protein